MSYKEGDQIHIEDEDATAGVQTGVMRWVLLISLLAAILILSVIWIAGAWLQDSDDTSYVAPPPPPPIEEIVDTDGTLADDAVMTPADDEALGAEAE